MTSLPFSTHASKYRQYKDDTQYIAAWLATTAQKHGFKSSFLVPHKKGSQPAKVAEMDDDVVKKRLDGRKQSNASIHTHVLKTKDFIILAKYLTKQNCLDFKIPHQFFTILDRAISLRLEVGLALRNENQDAGSYGPERQRSDTNHSHFVDVLENVRELLNPQRQPHRHKHKTVPQASTTSLSKNAIVTHLNKFSQLQMEEPAELLNDTRPGTPTKDKAYTLASSASSSKNTMAPTMRSRGEVFKVEALDDPTESMIALDCLLADFAELCAVICETWESYKSGEIDLLTTAMVTHIAMELAADFALMSADTIEGKRNEGDLFEQYFSAKCMAANIDPNARLLDTDEMNLDAYELSSTFGGPAFHILKCFLGILYPKKARGKPPKHWDAYIYDPHMIVRPCWSETGFTWIWPSCVRSFPD